MLGDYKKKVELLNQLELSNEEFDFLYMIQIYRNEMHLLESQFIVEFQKYYLINKHKYKYSLFFKKYENLGYIINLNKDEKDIDFTKIIIQDRFKTIFILDIDKCWEEVKSLYPSHMYIYDRLATLQMSKRDLKSLYYNVVIKGGDKYLHEEFISLTENFYSGQKKTTRSDACSLEKWLMSWDSMKDIILQEINGENVNQYKLF